MPILHCSHMGSGYLMVFLTETIDLLVGGAAKSSCQGVKDSDNVDNIIIKGTDQGGENCSQFCNVS